MGLSPSLVELSFNKNYYYYASVEMDDDVEEKPAVEHHVNRQRWNSNTRMIKPEEAIMGGVTTAV